MEIVPIRIYGSSDDLLEIETTAGRGNIESYGDAFEITLLHPDGERSASVFVTYMSNATWAVGVGLNKEGELLLFDGDPRLSMHMNEYSMQLEAMIPKSTVILVERLDLDDRP